MSKKPSFQFYPGDWMKDPLLRRCSQAARGVWIDMLCLMFEVEKRGVLISGGVPWTNEEIANAITGPQEITLSCIDELLRLQVASRNKAGAIFSRRLVRDEQNMRYERDKKRNQRKVSPECPDDVPAESPPSSSSLSFSTSTSKPIPPTPQGGQPIFSPEAQERRRIARQREEAVEREVQAGRGIEVEEHCSREHAIDILGVIAEAKRRGISADEVMKERRAVGAVTQA